MTAASWQTVSIIVGLLVSVVTVYYLVRSNIREQLRQREAELDRAVTNAKAPLIAENAQLSGLVAQLRMEKQRSDESAASHASRLRSEKQRSDELHAAEIARKDARITELEDRLYGRGGL